MCSERTRASRAAVAHLEPSTSFAISQLEAAGGAAARMPPISPGEGAAPTPIYEGVDGARGKLGDG
jgi:hypothetical protein